MANKCLDILVRVDVIHVNILVVRTCGDHKKILVTIMLNKVHLRREKQQTPLMLKFKTSQKCIKKLTKFLKNVESRRRRNYSSSKQSGVSSVPPAASGQEDCPSHCRATLLAGG